MHPNSEMNAEDVYPRRFDDEQNPDSLPVTFTIPF
jgi:hypothetical protein